MSDAIKKNDVSKFLGLMQASWEVKKSTSPLILENEKLKEMDRFLYKDKSILAHRLCGAGNGGFFLIFRDKNYNEPVLDIPIGVAETPYLCTKN
jgi:galactokinase/mevalonate kinase-like predicted kinase